MASGARAQKGIGSSEFWDPNQWVYRRHPFGAMMERADGDGPAQTDNLPA